MPRKSNHSRLILNQAMEMLLIALVLIIGIVIIVVIDRHNQHLRVTQSILNNGVEELNQDKVLMLFMQNGVELLVIFITNEIVQNTY